VAGRGQDFAVHEQIQAHRADSGVVAFRTNCFTLLLENALHYFEDGQWKESEDLIEPFPGGAVARRGPTKAVFSPELNTAAVFDLQAADGRRVRGGVRALQVTDVATGQSLVLGMVKKSVPGRLVPPNRIVYADAFDGLRADVVLEWRQYGVGGTTHWRMHVGKIKPF
jgi:hypothetical protein